ncbi:MAG: InlB B-repeat-containing protein, partial [Oscillospiraceae bacterium]|nr:InlB B-repeat-containing protein [Oscillospiraceae bacterium]
MRKTLLKALSGLLVLLMLVSLCPTNVSAASSYPNTHVNTGDQAADIVAVAVSQAGYCEGSLSGNPSYASSNNYQKFGQWYDANVDNIGVTRAAWCAAFVSWCANQAGVPSSVVYYHAYCPYGVNWFRNQGRFKYAASRGGTYVPKAGDIVYFAPAGSSTSSHVGIVRYVSNGYVYTVEGNTSGQNGEVNEGGGVFLKSYSLSYSRLYGYGTPNYSNNSGHTISFDSNGGSAVADVQVKEGGTLSAPANPTRYGFNFVGWYCNPELTDPYVFGSPVPYSFTLYAKWEEAYWGANTNLMPVDGLLVRNNYNNSDQYVWPYYNDDGSVTIYNGVSDSNSWPSAYMSYENSVDSGNDAYIYVKYNATAGFNATIDYLDADGNPQSVKLSQLAGRGDTDFPPGYEEFFVNFGQYVYDQGHLTTSDGSAHSVNIKYIKVTYYVVGGLDSYVRLYDMKFTPAFEIEQAYASLMSSDITQNDGSGSYVYHNGVLTATSNTDLGYSLTMNTNQQIDPTDFCYLLAGINSSVPFNISMDVVKADGTTATVDFASEFYPAFGGLAEKPEALPAGTWSNALDLLGYFRWNGGETSVTSVSNITITLEGQGTLTLNDLQASRGMMVKAVNDGQSASGSYDNTYLITFVSNGGSEVTSVHVREGETLTCPTDPTRYGYVFAGWYCDPELNDPYDFTTPVPYSFNLYAKWEPWPINHNLMPVESKLQLDNYQGSGQYIWPYYNDDGSVTFYNGVTNDENHSWPSAWMDYENSINLDGNAYIHLKYDASADFNAEIQYMDSECNLHTAQLSKVAGLSTTDFPAGTHEYYIDFGSWLLAQDHIPDSMRQNYTKVTYYVVGGLDEYVRLYDFSCVDAYTVTFNSNGGSEVYRMAVEKGQPISAPEAPTRYGYDFVGWYCDPALQDPYDFSQPVNYSFVLYAKWALSQDAVYDGGMAGDGVIYAEGFDISFWNGESFDLQAIKDAGYDYVIIRCGSTNLGEDGLFDGFYEKARAVGLDIGTYFYSYATTPEAAIADANKCLSYIEGKTFEYPIYFDYEDPCQNDLSQAQSTEICLAFMDTVANAGYLAGMYSGAYRLSTLDMATLGADYEVWVAHYKDNSHETMDPTYSTMYGMYQYTDSQYVGSIGGFDANVCYKDYPTIVKTYGLNGYSRPTCEHNYVESVTAPTCTVGGYSTFTCTLCGDTYTGNETASTGHSHTYTDNGETHTVGCNNCDYSVTEGHTYENGACICGAVEVTGPAQADIKISHTVSFDSDLKMNYRIKYENIAAAIPNYVTEGAYLVVEKDQYLASGEFAVDTVTLYPDLESDP